MKKITLLDRRKKAKEPEPVAPGFWRTKALNEMNTAEWEALCDRCSKCCVISLEDADTGVLYRTDVSCKLFDTAACQCSDYANRKQYVPDCVKLTPRNVPKLDWLPQTCAYRLIAEGKELYWWHPLISGTFESVHVANASAKNRTRPEGRLKMAGLMKRIVHWPEPLEKPPKAWRKAKTSPRRGGASE